MLEVDEFESAFKSAAKEVFRYERIEFNDVLVLTDLDQDGADQFAAGVQQYLATIGEANWTVLTGEADSSVDLILEAIESHKPDLICTYRHLHSGAWKWPYSLGTFVDVIIQVAPCPVLMLPRPDAKLPSNTDEVSAVTDHLTGDHQLVNCAVRLTSADGKLYLTHVEDETTFERYIETIGKIPSIDTDNARDVIHKQLLKEPADYIDSVSDVLKTNGVTVKAEKIVATGHHLEEYKRIILDHGIDLLVMHGRDVKQVAMHGLAYPLAIELRDTPILLI